MDPVPCLVDRKRRESGDTYTLALKWPDNVPKEPFKPGQFHMLYAFGIGEVPVSLSGDPADPKVLLHTVRSVGPVTRALCGMRRGQVVGLRGPFGRPWPMDEAEGEDVLMIAGGLGLAPLRPAIYHVLAHRERYGRLIIAYGARGPTEVLYRQELQRWRARFGVEVRVTVDRADATWKGEVGVVTGLLPKLALDPISTVAFLCGPEVMMRFAALDLQKLGLAPAQIYVSMERNMKCAVGFCGHCQYGPYFLCKDGPVFRYDQVMQLMQIREV